jgi:UDP-GlcNAc:undecaprenyl-phosphate GlcNAc-1-phosphate transferase
MATDPVRDHFAFTVVLVFTTGILALAFTWLQLRLNRVLRITETPRADRWHRSPTPSSGGIAIFAAIALVYVVWFPGTYHAIAIGVAAIWLLGLLDDLLRFPPWIKLSAQAVASACVVASGVVFHATPSNAFNLAFSFLWLVGISNAFNLIDNMDGLCAGVTVIIALFRFSLLAAAGSWTDANLCALVAAAYAGFLILNRNPARIFMGDCGSMLAGFSLAALTIASPLAHTKSFVAGIFYPALTFTYPIFDTLLVSILRKTAGRSISVGGRDHSSHRLVSTGVAESRAVAILWALAAAGSAGGLIVRSMPIALLAAAGVIAMAMTVFGLFLATLPAYPLTPAWSKGDSRIRRYIPSLRAGAVMVTDVAVAGMALLVAFLIRFGPNIPPEQLRNLTISLPVVMVMHALFTAYRRMYGISWLDFSITDVWPLAHTVVLASACSFCCLWMLNLRSFSRGVMLLYGVFCVAGSLAVRSGVPILRLLLLKPAGNPAVLQLTLSADAAD